MDLAIENWRFTRKKGGYPSTRNGIDGDYISYAYQQTRVWLGKNKAIRRSDPTRRICWLGFLDSVWIRHWFVAHPRFGEKTFCWTYGWWRTIFHSWIVLVPIHKGRYNPCTNQLATGVLNTAQWFPQWTSMIDYDDTKIMGTIRDHLQICAFFFAPERGEKASWKSRTLHTRASTGRCPNGLAFSFTGETNGFGVPRYGNHPMNYTKKTWQHAPSRLGDCSYLDTCQSPGVPDGGGLERHLGLGSKVQGAVATSWILSRFQMDPWGNTNTPNLEVFGRLCPKCIQLPCSWRDSVVS